jgi:sugar (pentulose or hexulose) kinase
MSHKPVIAVFDIGRTHKKFLLFDGAYQVVEEKAVAWPDITDEDGYTCENMHEISAWMREQISGALQRKQQIKAINFSAHGASLVHLDAAGNQAAPMYDYMKPLPAEITDGFYGLFGGRAAFSRATGSPVLDMLNSGIQLYWLKHTRPELLDKFDVSLHLPQYGNYLFSGKKHADITSIGCHTGLWDFEKGAYHRWLRDEGVDHLMAPAEPVSTYDAVRFGRQTIPTGIGLHDSSAALLPFVYTASKPFLLLSSGTWNITLDPFFQGELSDQDYQRDCLYFLLDVERKVAASRLFLGHEYQHQVKKLEAFFQKRKGYYLEVEPDAAVFSQVLRDQPADAVFYPETMAGTGPFPNLKRPPVNLNRFSGFEEAYHKLMLDLTYMQKISLELLSCHSPVDRLYISGGFVQNHVFMELLHAFLPQWEIFIAENKRASALGAAVAMHDVWQSTPLTGEVSPIIPFKPTLSLDVSSYKSYFGA